MATWQTYADKHVNTPVFLVSIAFNSGTRYYSNCYVETSSQCYKGNILDFPSIQSSVGDIKRTYERNAIKIVFDDTDYEFRGLEDSETVSFKNRTVTISIAFADDTFTQTLTIFTGQIYDWKRLDDLRFEISVEEKSYNLENEYPDKRVELTDYANANGSAVGWAIPIPYGSISASGLSDDGAFGHPGVSKEGTGTGLLYVDTTSDAEKHLVGLQAIVEELSNGGFDSDVSGWTAQQTSTYSSVAGGKSGNCLKLEEDGTGTEPRVFAYVSNYVIGRRYRTIAYVKAGTENEYKASIYASGIGTITSIDWQAESAGDWSTKIELEWTCPTGATDPRVFLFSRSQNGEGKYIYFDSVETYEVIGVSNVFLDGVEKTVDTDYTIEYSEVDNKCHCLIAWESGPTITETSFVSADIWFGGRLPVEAIKHFMINHCGYSSGNFNTTSYNSAHDVETDRGYDFAGALWEPNKLQTILDQWRDEFELDIYWNKSGEVCFKYISSISGTRNQYTAELNIIDKSFTSDPHVDKLMNYLKFGWNYNYSKTYFHNYSYAENSDSQTKYGATYKDFKGFTWIRTQAVADDIANRKVLRFKDPITFDKMLFPLNTFSEDLADVIEVTHFLGTGSSGYSEERFQIRDVNYSLDKFTNQMLLENASNFIGHACILGDRTTLASDWTSASDADKEYFYVCGDAGTFTDGAEGKRLVD